MATTEERLAALEAEVTTLRERLDMEAGLAASRDRDLSELAVTHRSHTRMLQGLQEGLAGVRETLGQHTEELHELRAEVGELRAGQGTIIGMLTRLIEDTDG